MTTKREKNLAAAKRTVAKRQPRAVREALAEHAKWEEANKALHRGRRLTRAAHEAKYETLLDQIADEGPTVWCGEANPRRIHGNLVHCTLERKHDGRHEAWWPEVSPDKPYATWA